ncbi:actin II [Babesia ovis]|uniref:Actin II n=1 Tax=Babesia ovis TaxID=5869 RepID=A0A9W5TBF0_BABOV|nr:actin II [Babesia ovis]
MMMVDDTLALVVDTGSYSIKVGYSGAEKPQKTFRTLAAYQQNDELVVGNEALKYATKRAIISPVQHGIVRNWAIMERLWMHAFKNELNVSQMEHPVLLSEPPLNPKMHREKVCQLMFENFNVPGLYMSPTSLLGLYGAGKTTGLAVDIGEGVAHAVPINDGTIYPHAIGRLDVGGNDVTSHLVSMIPDLDPKSYYSRVIADEIKERYCYVAVNYKQQLKLIERDPEQYTKKYTLPDGKIITLMRECFEAPEILISPDIGGRYCPSLADIVYHSVRSCEPEVHKAMFTNILLTGGSTLYEGFIERCEHEFKDAANENMAIKIVPNVKNRNLCVWSGGSIVASLSTFQQMWVTKAEYEESGPTVIHRKCF